MPSGFTTCPARRPPWPRPPTSAPLPGAPGLLDDDRPGQLDDRPCSTSAPTWPAPWRPAQLPGHALLPGQLSALACSMAITSSLAWCPAPARRALLPQLLGDHPEQGGRGPPQLLIIGCGDHHSSRDGPPQLPSLLSLFFSDSSYLAPWPAVALTTSLKS